MEKMQMKGFAILIISVIALTALADTMPEIKNVTAKQRYPWNGKVDITYDVVGDLKDGLSNDIVPFLLLTATNRIDGTFYEATADALSGDMGMVEGTHHVVWDLNAQGLEVRSSAIAFTVAYLSLPLYCVIDLSAGANATTYPVTYVTEPSGVGFNTDEYKTAKLVLRLIEPGSFKMGGTYDVTLTKPFACGIFEVTQRQYELVMGVNPSCYKGDNRPVEQVSYNTIRGTLRGAEWPLSPAVDTTSFLGKLRVRTGLDFDLPTEAQWEYACRAGTTSSYNNGGSTESDLRVLGRYAGNKSDNKGGHSDVHTAVGSYLPNAWGLYDMHGNVWEWCLDWLGSLVNATNPKGAFSGSHRVLRGGSWNYGANVCVSSNRGHSDPSNEYDRHGFRLVRNVSNTEDVYGFDVICAGDSAYVSIDARIGLRESLGFESIAYSSLWHGGDSASVMIEQNGVVLAEKLTGEGTLEWRVKCDGTFTFTHTTYVNGI